LSTASGAAAMTNGSAVLIRPSSQPSLLFAPDRVHSERPDPGMTLDLEAT
jgi:hypothetical protein